MSTIIGFCVNYPNDFQSIIDDEGYDTVCAGYYIYCDTAYGNALILVPSQYKDYIAVTSDGELYNTSSYTIRGTCFVGNTTTKRDYYFEGLSFPQYNYRTQSGVQQFRELIVYEIYDTNIEFDDGCLNEFLNSSVYFTKYEKAVIISLITIIFLLFLGWFLLHKL